MLTDKAIPRDTIASAKPVDEAVEAAKAQGFAFAVTSGGVPLKEEGFRVWFRDGAKFRSLTHSGKGGFDIAGQSATQIKGRAMLGGYGVKATTDENAWPISFDAPVLRGNETRMQTVGEPLGATGGQPGTDLLAALQATRTMGFAALSSDASSELATFLNNAAAHPKNLKLLQGITSPKSRIAGGLRQGDSAQVYWIQIWPAARDNRCVDDLILKDGKWRSVASACQSEYWLNKLPRQEGSLCKAPPFAINRHAPI